MGGGLATLPFLYEIGAKTGWFTESDVLDMIAVSESTPGPIGVNMATYTGFTVGSLTNFAAGILDGVLVTLSLILPSLIIGIIISGFLARFKDSPLVNGTFSFLRPASAAWLAWNKRDEAVEYRKLSPLYLRPPQAERQKNLRERGHE